MAREEGDAPGGSFLAMAAAVLGIAIVAWLMRPGAPPPEATASRYHAPAPIESARLELTIKDGTVTVVGAVANEATRGAVMGAIRAVFGAAKVTGDVSMEAARMAPPWLAGLRGALEAMKTFRLHVLFEGDTVTVDGIASPPERTNLRTLLRVVFGTGIDPVVHLADRLQDMQVASADDALNGLAALGSDFSPQDLARALNQLIVNFDPGGSAVPESAAEVLRKGAAKMKALPRLTRLEVAGHTDNAGDAAANRALSEQRAAAVRAFLIDEGVSASLLIAKGYGPDNPAAPNDTPEGRFRNRRIEFRVLP